MASQQGLEPTARILIIGAGAMGVIMGQKLQSGGAAVTYLVRPNRSERLSRPQRIYSYDDHTLREHSGYRLITHPEISRGQFDLVIFTIDGSSLRSSEGQALVAAVGRAARGTATQVLIGTLGANLRPGFLATSKLNEDQVFSGCLYIMAYQADRVSLPVHPPSNAELLAKADFAYRQAAPVGFFADDSAPAATACFVRLWEADGTSKCQVWSKAYFAAAVPAVFPMFVARDAMGWPHWSKLESDRALWETTAAATREIMGLKVWGDAGKAEEDATTADSLIERWRSLEEETYPADLLEFNRFHHGGKVYQQDVEILEDCVALGVAEGQPMVALKQLIERARASHGAREAERRLT